MNLADAVAAMGSGALTEEHLRLHVFPLFSKTLARPGIYLANHSLGRPLDQTEDDLREGFHLWQSKLGDAWDDWTDEEHAHRSRLAQLIGASRADCIVPKTSAGQGLRTVLNALGGVPRVVSTVGEFDSVDVILKQYAAVGRISLQLVTCQGADGGIDLSELMEMICDGVDLVVISQVMFMTGQVVHDLDAVAEQCHRVGARLLVDAYHAVGVFPVDVARMNADFMIGGSYKYLRGGPGAAFLYVSPEALLSGLRPIDIGWFAKEQPFNYERPDPPRFASGGDVFLESTPPVLTYYQARAGQQLTLQLGVTRIREYAMDRLGRLKRYLADAGIEAEGGDGGHGAFLTIETDSAVSLAGMLEDEGITTDARGRFLRLSPDYLTPDSAMREVATALASVRTS
ncbi:aminotransferase class V-fold PLP-dependent enzyme [Tunturiibacter lichenicola]|uniref:aminotransferase class V-fold PLP-dependent enzyme n=1 Tax=Tunturiibacter lichenicola TaxID=2051959 RepID=UPI0021B447E1|nr:aminotransferase class V-fold PLP-dependent enzyme [Edaphobacter lichenicola]